MKVKVLDSHLINVIAAGEVIDRPASVVKELVENSLDAGAARIDVQIEQGGLSVIRVSDDGEGMDRQDLELSILRHTTSKIATQQDLERIRTLGFRGEALASICEVARVRISSRTAHSHEGFGLEVEGGKAGPPQALGRATGTTVEVRELFFNVPARRKFQKSERAETFHVTRLMKRFLFSHPRVHLLLTQGNRPLLDSPPSEDLMEIAAHLYGHPVASGLVPVSFQGEILKVEGWVSTSQRTRADRNEQYTYVNARAVSDPVLHYAIVRAYEGQLEGGRHPYVCLHLTLEPSQVDVNVHPQKHEVRFLDAQAVKRDLLHAMTQALVSRHAAPQLPWKAAEEALRFRPQRTAVDLHDELLQRRERTDIAPGSFSPTPGVPVPPELGSPAPAPAGQAQPQTQSPQTHWTPVEEERVVGQIHGTYIVVQTPNGFELVDQHVAHERVLYERLLRQLAQGGVHAQKLLVPEVFRLPPDQLQLLEAHTGALAGLGIELEPFGADAFLIRAWPQSLAAFHAEAGYQDALEALLELLSHEGETRLEALAKVLAASLACEAAVVKHTLLPLEAMRHLVHELKRLQDPYHCPHGRPIILQYDLAVLERAFKRR